MAKKEFLRCFSAKSAFIIGLGQDPRTERAALLLYEAGGCMLSV